MSAECARAALARRESFVSFAQPALARSSLTSASTVPSKLVSPRRVGLGTGRVEVFVGFGVAFGFAEVGAGDGPAEGLVEVLASGADGGAEDPVPATGR